MKIATSLFCLILSFLIVAPASAQLNTWRSQNPPTVAGNLEAVQMINKSTTYVVGELTTFIAVTDSGRSWSVRSGIAPEKKRKNQTLLGLSFIDSSEGITVGPGLVLKTVDAGNTWVNMTGVSNQLTYTGVLMLSKDIIILIGKGGLLLRSIDGGKNWSPASLELGVDMTAIKKVREDFIVVSAEDGYLFVSADSGKTWGIKKMQYGNTVNSVAFENEDKAVAVGELGFLVSTNDKGTNWILHTWDTMGIIVSNHLNAVDTRSPGRYVAVGSYNTLIYSDDGGSHWKKGSLGIFLTTGLDFNDIWMWDKDYGFAVGNMGSLIRTTNGGATWDFIPQNPLFARMYGIAFPKGDSSHGIAVGSGGTVLTTSDGGKRWNSVTSNVFDLKTNLYSVTFADTNTAFACGSNGKIFISSDYGATWDSQITNTPRDLISISFVDHDNGWATGVRNVLLQTKTAGKSWYYVFDGTAPDTITNVSFCDKQSGITGRRYTTNGGFSWDTVASPVSTTPDNAYFVWGYYLKSHMISPTHYVVIATAFSDTRDQMFGTILTRIGDSEYYFGDQITTFFINFTAVDFADSAHGTVVGTDGTVYQTTDGGRTWNLQTTPTGLQLEAVSMPLPNVASASGIRGIILRRTNSVPLSAPSEHSASTNSSFSIESVYPNPAQDNTTLKIALTRSMPLEIRLYDIKGVEVKSFDLGMQSEGQFEIPFSLSGLSDGTYVVELRSASESKHVQLKVIQ